MKFIVTLIALLMERFFDCSHLRQWQWYAAYQRMVSGKLVGKPSYLILAATIIPILLAVALVQAMLAGWLYGLLSLMFQLFILLFCLGPQNLWADTFACVNDVEKLKALFGITETGDAQKLHQQFLNSIFIEANRRVFAVVFWYAILGPVGAVLYRLVTISSLSAGKADVSPEMVQQARHIETILDWLPVRVFTFIFALGGNFVKVLASWRKKAPLQLSSNEEMIVECGVAGLGNDEQVKIAEDGSAEKGAISLLDRVFVIVLVLVAIIVLVT
jgi:AmpE protein